MIIRLHKIECCIRILRYSRLHSTVEICHLIHFASNETEKCPSIDIFSIDFTSDAPSVLLLKLRQCYVITGSFKVEKCLLSQQMSTRRSKWWPKKLPPHRRNGAFQGRYVRDNDIVKCMHGNLSVGVMFCVWQWLR